MEEELNEISKTEKRRQESVNEFIEYMNKNHPNGYYCEILIKSDGTIIKAEPSHLHALMKIYGIPERELFDENSSKRKELWRFIPPAASPIEFLSEYLNCAVVWYAQIILPKRYTENHIHTIADLAKQEIIAEDYQLKVSVEKTRFRYIAKEQFNKINNIYKQSRELESSAKQQIYMEAHDDISYSNI